MPTIQVPEETGRTLRRLAADFFGSEASISQFLCGLADILKRPEVSSRVRSLVPTAQRQGWARRLIEQELQPFADLPRSNLVNALTRAYQRENLTRPLSHTSDRELLRCRGIGRRYLQIVRQLQRNEKAAGSSLPPLATP